MGVWAKAWHRFHPQLCKLLSRNCGQADAGGGLAIRVYSPAPLWVPILHLDSREGKRYCQPQASVQLECASKAPDVSFHVTSLQADLCSLGPLRLLKARGPSRSSSVWV